MKKLLSLLIIIATLLSLFGCGKKYPEVKSTAEEDRVVITLEADNKKYEIKYELYRALFWANKKSVDKGDDSVWQSDKANEYIEKIDEIIIEKASEIYSVLHLAEKLGINPYSKDVEDRIYEQICIAVEGGYGIAGFGGDYDAYLADLAKIGINYSVQDLLFRYSIATEKINEYYIGVEDEATDTMLRAEITEMFFDISSRLTHFFHLGQEEFKFATLLYFTREHLQSSK